MSDRTEIHSYHRVFRTDKRIYRVDRWLLPVPGGVPISGLAYFGVALLAVALCGQIPVVAQMLGVLSPPLRYVALPLGIAYASTQATPDGRSALRFGVAWVAVRARRWMHAGRARPVAWQARLPVGWDVDSPTLRRCRVVGPTHVTFHEPVGLTHGRRVMVARRGRGETCDVVDARGVEVR